MRLSGGLCSISRKAHISLYGADLSGANLAGADLSHADLTGAYISRADLTGADLHRAYLFCANLSGANLSGADLTSADLTGAKYGEKIPLEHIPLMLHGTKYNIIIMDKHIKIGCKLYSHAEWESFSDDQIAQMDDGALTWWNEWKMTVLDLSRLHQQHIADS